MSITTSLSLALSICLMFISVMQLVNGAQCLNTTPLFLLFGAPTAPLFRNYYSSF